MKINRGVLIFIAIVVGVAFFCGFLPNILTSVGLPQAVSPVITLPGEQLSARPLIDLPGEYSDIYLTNSLVGTWVSYLIMLLVAVFARIGMKEVPSGLQNTAEAAVEGLYGITQDIVGSKFARTIFPIAATIFVLIFIANWLEMVPPVDSVGLMHHAEPGMTGYPRVQIGSSNAYYLDASQPQAVPAAAEGEAEHVDDEHALWIVTPFIRAAATDINFALGLAIVTFLMVQVVGSVALGFGYLAKFINTPALERGGMGFMDFGVGLLELVLEPVKMVSLTFRLLGNIFGGAVLLFVLSVLVPFLIPTALYLYELFVGAIQAYVFFMLTLIYASVAMASHGDEH